MPSIQWLGSPLGCPCFFSQPAQPVGPQVWTEDLKQRGLAGCAGCGLRSIPGFAGPYGGMPYGFPPAPYGWPYFPPPYALGPVPGVFPPAPGPYPRVPYLFPSDARGCLGPPVVPYPYAAAVHPQELALATDTSRAFTG